MGGVHDHSTGPVRVVFNPRAGGFRPTDPREELARELEASGVSVEIETVAPTELATRVAEARGLPLIAVAGGDGSQRTAAAALLGSDTALAPVPTGRLNHFARRAGLATIADAARAIGAGGRARIAVGRVAGEAFLDTAVVGAYPEFIRLRERLRPRLTTWPAAAIAALVLLARWPRVPITFRTPDHQMEVRTLMLWVGVGRNSFPAPHKAPLPAASDVLQVVLLPGGRRSAARLAQLLFRYRLRGRPPIGGSGLTVLAVPWIELDSPGPIPIALDGEPRSMAPPLRLDLAEQPLQVVVPRS